MTYTTKKILANFLHNDEGLLSKKFIETATLLFGQGPAKRVFKEALRRNNGTTNYFIKDPLVVFPGTTSDGQSRLINEVISLVQDWYPGSAETLQRTGRPSEHLFEIFLVTPYRYDSPDRSEYFQINDLINTHMSQCRQQIPLPHQEAPLAHYDTEYTKLLKELLYETVYDSVTAQGYNRPADSTTLREYFMSLMRDNPSFSWTRWFDPEVGFVSPNQDRSGTTAALL